MSTAPQKEKLIISYLNFLKSPESNQDQIPPCHINNAIIGQSKKNGRWQLSNPVSGFEGYVLRHAQEQ